MDFARKTAWTKIAFWLVGSTLVYNVVEAGVSLWAGAKAESVALLGFGLGVGLILTLANHGIAH